MMSAKGGFMYIKCPECGFGREVPEDKIPAQAKKATCPKCGARFDFRDSEEESVFPVSGSDAEETPSQSAGSEENIWSQLENMGRSEPSDSEDAGSEQNQSFAGEKVPWENLEEEGFFPGFLRTIKKAMLAPASFFSGMPLLGLIRPLVFYLILTELQAVATFLWQMTGFLPMMGAHGQAGGVIGLGVMGAGSIALLIIYPVILTIMLFIVAGINHLLLRICGAGAQGFEGTFRVVTYGNSPMILGVIPFLGPLVGGLWAMVVTIIGYKNIHDTTYGRVILAFLLPFIVGMALFLLFSLFAG
jgi:predicted Zn finger-like uncharacterized protein